MGFKARVTGQRFEVYKDGNGEWRWKLLAANGTNIGQSGEGYKNKAHAVRMAAKIKALPASTPVVVPE